MKVKEIGSVFHFCQFPSEAKYLSYPEDSLYYGCGRYAINALIIHHMKAGEWKRLFVPEYFCYEVIDSIRMTGIKIIFYPDYPSVDDNSLIKKIKFIDGDVLLRMNYFGLRNFRDNSDLDVAVIEDHSHNLFSDWALNSNADWCIASLRKTLPIPDGGILWSPKNNISLIGKPILDSKHSKLSEDRFRAMEMKSMYLDSEDISCKNDYLSLFNNTEALIGKGNFSALSNLSIEIMKKIPSFINQKKYDNYESLAKLLKPVKCEILPYNEHQTPFSLVLLFETKGDRDCIREKLTLKNIYSNILWKIRNGNANEEVKMFSDRMISLPVDFRYSESDMLWMSQVINSELSKL